MALNVVASAENATLAVDIDAQGSVVAIEVNVPGPRSAVVSVRNPAGQSVRGSIVLAPQATPYRYAVPSNRRAVWDDGLEWGGSGWSYVFGSA